MSSIAEELDGLEPSLLEQVNGEHADSTLLVARHLAGRPDATAARITGVDARGLHLEADGPNGTTRAHLPFDTEVTTLADLWPSFTDLVHRAREASGEEGRTSVERAAEAATGYRTVLAEVVAVRDVLPTLREITFGGPDLADYASPGPDAFLYVLLPPPGRTQLTIDRTFTWSGYEQLPDEEKPVGAYYTVRRWDPVRHELHLQFVLHDDPGPAATWAARAEPGDPVALWGPRTAFEPPPGADRYVLCADETGLPAVAAILEWLPPDVPATVLASVADRDHIPPMPDRPGTTLTWCCRDEPGADPRHLLAEAVRALPPFEGTPYVWGGGEAKAMTAVRRHVRHERGLPQDAVSLVAYWRQGPADPDDD